MADRRRERSKREKRASPYTVHVPEVTNAASSSALTPMVEELMVTPPHLNKAASEKRRRSTWMSTSSNMERAASDPGGALVKEQALVLTITTHSGGFGLMLNDANRCTCVPPQTPPAQAGLRPFDRLVAVDGVRLCCPLVSSGLAEGKSSMVLSILRPSQSMRTAVAQAESPTIVVKRASRGAPWGFLLDEVSRVTAVSSAARGGLQVSDRILEVDKHAVTPQWPAKRLLEFRTQTRLLISRPPPEFGPPESWGVSIDDAPPSEAVAEEQAPPSASPSSCGSSAAPSEAGAVAEPSPASTLGAKAWGGRRETHSTAAWRAAGFAFERRTRRNTPAQT